MKIKDNILGLSDSLLNSKSQLFSVIRFVIIGGFNTLCNLLWYSLFISLGVYYATAYVISYIICIVISFFLNCFFVFKTPPTFKKFVTFPLSSIPNFIISSVAIIILVDTLHLDKYLSNLLSAVISIPITYLLARYLLNRSK